MALTDNLISVWELTEASGNALDSHGSNDLTDNNTVGAGTGKIIGARDFESANSEYFSRADNADLSMGDIDFTIACWVLFESVSTFQYQGIVTKGSYNSGATEEYNLMFDGFSNKPTFRGRFDGSTAGQAVWAAGLSSATWYWLVGEHRATANQLAINVNNGTAVTASYSSGVRDSTAGFSIGSFGPADGSSYFDGLVEQVAIWKRLLTSDEKAELYNSGNGLAYSSWAGGGGGTAAPFRRRSTRFFRKSF